MNQVMTMAFWHIGCFVPSGNHMLSNAKMQFYDHSLHIPMLFSGPGIAHGSTLDFLGTQVRSSQKFEQK